jgi:NADH-quinone oxidoreductase subunit A
MERSSEYIGLLVAFVMAAGIATLILLLNSLLGPKNKSNPAKSLPFECGKDPFDQPAGQFSVKFYLIAMLFILFDVEIVWFFPWAVLLRKLGWVGIFEMFAFITVLTLGFVYAWKKGALEWEK